jgi:lysophospholipase L1-like esterase
MGWGVQNQETYTSLLARDLQLVDSNFSQIGYSSAQGLLLWKNKLKSRFKKLKIVMISYGINDLDKFRFFENSFDSDLDYFKNLQNRQQKSEKIFFFTNISVLSQLVYAEWKLTIRCEELAKITQRLSTEESLSQLRELIKDLKPIAEQIVLINTPYKKMNVNPDYARPKIENLYASVRNLAHENNCHEALEKLKEAKALEPSRVAEDVIVLNRRLKELSEEFNIKYVDAWDELSRGGHPEEFFVDPVHPSPQGHFLLSRLIEKNLLK